MMNTGVISSVGVQNYGRNEKQISIATRKPAAGGSMETYQSKVKPDGTHPDQAKLTMKDELNVEIANKLDEIFKTGKMKYVDLDEQAFRILKESPTEASLNVLNQFIECNLDRSSMFSALLNTMMELYALKQTLTATNKTSISSIAETDTVDEGILERGNGSFNTKHVVELNPTAAEFVPKFLQNSNIADQDEDYTGKNCYSTNTGYRMNENYHFKRGFQRGTGMGQQQKFWYKSNGWPRTISSYCNTPEAATRTVSYVHWCDAYPLRNPELGVFWNHSNCMCNIAH